MNERFIKRYQDLLVQNPSSQVFAPLAEGYRKLGMIDEGLAICERGIDHNPHFSGGFLVYGRLLLANGEEERAIEVLLKATELAPENVLAQNLLAGSLLKAKRNKEALEALKMILFMNPNNEKVYEQIKKLESLTADEYEDEAFAMHPLKELEAQVQALKSDGSLDVENSSAPMTGKTRRILERYISLTDAFIVRNNVDKALETLNEAERLMGMQEEIQHRLQLLNDRSENSLLPDKKMEPADVPKEELTTDAQDLELRSEKQYRLRYKERLCRSLLQRISDRAN